ncbi:MAG: NUDIX domain-containing protein [Halobacteria archaeon]
MRVNEELWSDIVGNVPVVSVDLIAVDDRSRFLLGLRESNVAQDTWFVPGGRIYKNELLRDTVDRIADEEVGLDVEVIERIGAYQHFYDESDVGASSGKHYVAIGYVVSPVGDDEPVTDDQHSELRWFEKPPEATHPYTMKYLHDADLV